MRHPELVVKRPPDVDVPIGADGAQVQYRRRRAHYVRRYPDVAEDGAERPPSGDVVDDGERHDGDGDERVGERQRDDEVVARLAEIAICQDGDDDEQVAGDGGDDERRQQRADDHPSGDVDKFTSGGRR